MADQRLSHLVALVITMVLGPVMAFLDQGPAAAIGQTFVVDSTADGADASLDDGRCATAGPASVCTLRAALQQANATAGHDRIEFRIAGTGPHRISPSTALPMLTDQSGVTIDGYTQPGSSMNTLAHGSNARLAIELRGRGPGAIDGLDIRSSRNVVQGLAIFDFHRTVRFWGSAAHDNEVLGNFIGTDATGTFGQPARVINNNAVHLENGAADNVIGKPGRANRNVLSGNGDKGVAMYDEGTDRNVVQNNVIGLSPSGARLRNWGHGIDINYDAGDNLIGGRGVEHANVVSGNELSGIEISHDRGARSTTGNQVIGNLIGTGIDGTTGSTATRNHEFGVNLEGKPTCPTVASCGPDISANLVESNTIVGSDAGVMIWKGAHDNIVRNNRIGVLPDGTVPPSSANTIWGVLIEAGAFDNLVETNVIAGVLEGIQIRPDNNYTNEPTNPSIPTGGNTLRRNSIWGIVNGFGIDIAPISTANDQPGKRDPAIQGGIAFPVIGAATEDTVNVQACAGCRVELFATDADLSSVYGQGRTFLADGEMGPDGAATFVFRTRATDPLVLHAGDRLSATATDALGNTSEFAVRVTVVSGTIGTTTPSTPTTSTPTTSTPTTSTTVPGGASGPGSGGAGGDLLGAHRCGGVC